MKTMTIVDRALQYLLVDGFSVIPVGKDKLPILKSWHEYQNRLPTEEEIKEWWTKYPQANVAILTGKISGITVVDVDTYRGASIKPFPKSYTVKTGNGGIQLYYKYASGYTISSNAYKDYPNVDIRGDGGYVVAPPSVTDYIKDGKRMGGLYELIDAQEFAPFPDHLFKDKKEKKSKFKLNVQSGSRNSDLASAIGTLLRPLSEKEFSKEGWLATQAINNTYKPPLPEKELQSIFESIAKKELTRRQKPQPTLSPIQLDDSDVIISRLRVNSNNVPYKDMTNAYLVISQHSKTAGKIKYNTFTQEIEFNGKALEETDLTVIVMILQKELLPNISKEAVYSAIQHYAFENRYDEAQNWLKSLVWV